MSYEPQPLNVKRTIARYYLTKFYRSELFDALLISLLVAVVLLTVMEKM